MRITIEIDTTAATPSLRVVGAEPQGAPSASGDGGGLNSATGAAAATSAGAAPGGEAAGATEAAAGGMHASPLAMELALATPSAPTDPASPIAFSGAALAAEGDQAAGAAPDLGN